MFETLESRQLLSVSVSAGVLTVTGHNNQFVPDLITVLQDTFVANQKYVITENFGSGYLTTKKVVDAAPINEIVVNALAGDDIIKVDSSTFQDRVTINGGAGDDFMTGGLERDTFNGGAGSDTANYGVQGPIAPNPAALENIVNDLAHNTLGAGVWVTIDGVDNDGVPTGAFMNQERDNVLESTENVVGTNFADVIIGSDDDNVIYGLAGADQIWGDPIGCDDGGDDYIDGGAGRDFMFGGPGNDTIEARDGAEDFINGGPGDADAAFIDLADITLGSVSDVELLVF